MPAGNERNERRAAAELLKMLDSNEDRMLNEFSRVERELIALRHASTGEAADHVARLLETLQEEETAFKVDMKSRRRSLKKQAG
jgi:hypothetical protein